MQITRIRKKKKDQFRTIYIPSEREKDRFRGLIPGVEKSLCAFEENGKVDSNVIQGFRYGRSPVSNAWMHVGFKFTLSMDLADFFDSVNASHLKGLVRSEVIEKGLVDGAPRQGLPSSPAICNLAATKMDSAICRFIKKNKLNVVYTRYADDLSLSFNDRDLYCLLRDRVKNIVGKCGFKLNPNKTRLQSASFGNREITGVMAGEDGVSVSRKFKRRMRAAKHQGNDESFEGMLEFSRLKLPSGKSVQDFSQLETLGLLRDSERGGKAFPKSFEPRPLREVREGNFLITNDLAYLWGMTDLAEGWTSCYKKGGQNAMAPVFLSQFDVSVGLVLSNSVARYCGLKRHKIKARCIIYHAKDGRSYARSFYGNDPYLGQLRDFLKRNQIVSQGNGFTVRGYGKPFNKSCMYDGIHKSTVRLKGKPGNFVKLRG